MTKERQLVPLAEVHRRPGYEWVTPRRARRLRAEHRVPYHKLDGRIFFDLADIDAYVEAGRVEAVR